MDTKAQRVNKDLLQKRFASAISTYNKHAIVQKQMAKNLVKIARNYIPHKQETLLEIGCGTGLLTSEILHYYDCSFFIANDLVESVQNNIKTLFSAKSGTSHRFLQGDVEKLKLPNSLSSIWSGATIQWLQDIKPFFFRISKALKSDGFVALSSFDIQNLKEIKSITGKGIHYRTMSKLLDYASKYFSVIDSQVWIQKLWFQEPKDVLKHMQLTGVNAISTTKWNKSDFVYLIEQYENFKGEKGYPLTYHPFVVILQKK